MRLSTRRLIHALVAASIWTTLFPLATAASAGAESPRFEATSAEQVRSAFARAGYRTGGFTTWPMDATTTFFVQDPTPSDRMVLVMVYPDLAAAELGRARRDPDAPLVQGYGRALWSGNVVAAQASTLELGRQASLELEAECGSLVRTDDTPTLSSAPLHLAAVDADLAAVMRVAALATDSSPLDQAATTIVEG